MVGFEEIILDRLNSIQDDVKDIQAKTNDLCTRTAVLETNYKNHVNTEVRRSEKKYKIIAVAVSVVSGVSTIYNWFK